MKVVFRVDSSTKIGAGHVMRCLTLADELKRQKHQVIFTCREFDGSLISHIQKNYLVCILPSNKKKHLYSNHSDCLVELQRVDAEQTIKKMPKNTDMLIVDSYSLGKEWHKQLRPFTNTIVVIDDLADKSFDCDILLNQNLGSDKEMYQNKVPKKCKLILGSEYALIRPEFLKYRSKSLFKRKSTREVKNILVSMGGSDNENITYKILQKLDGNFNIVVVLGAISVHKEMIEKYAVGKTIKVVFDVDNMAQLMFDADLSIGAGGATSWERCCLGLPTLMYITADNQKNVAKNLNKSGAVKIVRNLKSDLTEISSNFNLWINMSNQAAKVCDGMGGLRFLEILERSVK